MRVSGVRKPGELTMSIALVLTYHAVDSGSPPLSVEPALFREHLSVIAEAGVRTVTIAELAAELRAGDLASPAVAITFDDGFRSVAEVAATALADRGMCATVFCVAGHLGGRSDWPSARPGGFVAELASADELRELARSGFEIGSHGMTHEPLVGEDEAVLQREVVDSRRVLEDATGTAVTSHATPYGAGPGTRARALLEATYAASCSTRLGFVDAGADPYALPRIDAHYVRRPEYLRRAIDGSLDGYLRLRGVGSRVRRTIRKDYARARAVAEAR